MTNHEMLEIAMAQSAEDMGCAPQDFLAKDNVVASLNMGNGARKYLEKPISCYLVSYGNNVVAATTDELSNIVSEYVDKYTFYHCFETPHMHWLNERLSHKGHKVCYMAEYYLPDLKSVPHLSCPYQTRVLGQQDFGELYLPEWSNALCKERPQLDVLGVGAYDGSRLVGLAACSADCEDMWQIGIDVLPEYRRQGIACALTSELTRRIVDAGKVPFYCTAWSNIRSVRNAVKSGFIPTWVELTAKPVDVVDRLNQ